MKKFTFLLVIAAFLAVSCEKNDEPVRNNEVQSETRSTPGGYGMTIIDSTNLNAAGMKTWLVRSSADQKGICRIYYQFKNPAYIKPKYQMLMFWGYGDYSDLVLHRGDYYDKDLGCYFFSFPYDPSDGGTWYINVGVSDETNSNRNTSVQYKVSKETYDKIQKMAYQPI